MFRIRCVSSVLTNCGVPPDNAAPPAGQNSDACFASIRWSVLLAAAKSASPEAQAALDKLCRDYWYPLYAFLRLKRHNESEAKISRSSFPVDVAKLQKLVQAPGFLIDGGYGKIKGTTFRISNRGDETEASMQKPSAMLDV